PCRKMGDDPGCAVRRRLALCLAGRHRRPLCDPRGATRLRRSGGLSRPASEINRRRTHNAAGFGRRHPPGRRLASPGRRERRLSPAVPTARQQPL
ncbi:hypothetical protein LTR94_031202, partial [Friedmanniomyces endolithicus]